MGRTAPTFELDCSLVQCSYLWVQIVVMWGVRRRDGRSNSHLHAPQIRGRSDLGSARLSFGIAMMSKALESATKSGKTNPPFELYQPGVRIGVYRLKTIYPLHNQRPLISGETYIDKFCVMNSLRRSSRDSHAVWDSSLKVSFTHRVRAMPTGFVLSLAEHMIARQALLSV